MGCCLYALIFENTNGLRCASSMYVIWMVCNQIFNFTPIENNGPQCGIIWLRMFIELDYTERRID